ncbi:MAG: DciA family protein [Bacteroidota bacterium]
MPSNDLPLKDVLKAYINESKKFKTRLYQAKVNDYWQKTMSPSILRYTTEVKIYREKLYLKITSAPLRQELMLGREKIKDMMNEMLDEEYIKDVVIR